MEVSCWWVARQLASCRILRMRRASVGVNAWTILEQQCTRTEHESSCSWGTDGGGGLGCVVGWVCGWVGG